MNGGVGWRRRSFFSIFVTVQSTPGVPRSGASTSSMRAWFSSRPVLLSIFCPSTSTSRAVNGGGAARLDGPVLLGREGEDLALALADDAHGDGLHAPGGEPAAHLLPQERRELVADQAVEHATRLLRLEAVLVELPRVGERLEHRLLRDLVEHHAVHVLALRAELLRDVPGDGLALAVWVGREVDVLLVLRRLFDLRQHLRLAGDDLVRGLEVVFDVDAELRLGQVHHVAD